MSVRSECRLRQRARSRETPSGNRPRVGPPRSPASSSGAPRSRIVACVPCSRTSGSIRLSYAARMSGHTRGSAHRGRASGLVRALRSQIHGHRLRCSQLPRYRSYAASYKLAVSAAIFDPDLITIKLKATSNVPAATRFGLNETSGIGRLIVAYLTRFQMTVAVPPADANGTVYFNSSPAMAKERFCSA